jgi:RNA polymerase sigma-70 factor (ECF subfamily)
MQSQQLAASRPPALQLPCWRAERGDSHAREYDAGNPAEKNTGPRPTGDALAASCFRRLLDEVWPECQPRLVRLAVGLGCRDDQVADALQEVFLTALERPPPIVTADEMVRWLFRVTVNRCHLEHRRRGRWQRLWQVISRFVMSSEQKVSSYTGELAADVAEALGTLAPDDRALVAMRYFSDLNSRQIGEIVGMAEATVRGRLRAARRKLAEELEEWREG